jgi:hypothetical protein
MDKKDYYLVNDLNHLREYVLKSYIVAYVPLILVKGMHFQPDVLDTRRGKWITKIQEYDMVIRSTKIMK